MTKYRIHQVYGVITQELWEKYRRWNNPLHGYEPVNCPEQAIAAARLLIKKEVEEIKRHPKDGDHFLPVQVAEMSGLNKALAILKDVGLGGK